MIFLSGAELQDDKDDREKGDQSLSRRCCMQQKDPAEMEIVRMGERLVSFTSNTEAKFS